MFEPRIKAMKEARIPEDQWEEFDEWVEEVYRDFADFILAPAEFAERAGKILLEIPKLIFEGLLGISRPGYTVEEFVVAASLLSGEAVALFWDVTHWFRIFAWYVQLFIQARLGIGGNWYPTIAGALEGFKSVALPLTQSTGREHAGIIYEKEKNGQKGYAHSPPLMGNAKVSVSIYDILGIVTTVAGVHTHPADPNPDNPTTDPYSASPSDKNWFGLPNYFITPTGEIKRA